jgi:hypothetical protein
MDVSVSPIALIAAILAYAVVVAIGSIRRK